MKINMEMNKKYIVIVYMEDDYTTYTIEGALSLFITVLAYRMYKMRCNTSSKCCDDTLHADFHNGNVELTPEEKV